MKKAHRSASFLFQRSALCAALSLSIFGSAQALTLNRPVVQSKQGEALRAEIDISEITVAEQIELQANLASQEIYKAAQIEWPTNNGAPLEIQIQLWRRDNGKPFLKISSQQPVTRNAIDLLIDLRWSTGRLLRDFSLSLDDSKAAPAKPIAAPAVTSGTTTATSSQQISVQRGDTASELAVGKLPAGVSLDQMLLALVRSNPDAFVDANVNRMKAGALLTLPTEQEAKAVSREEAQREIQVQTKDFEAYRAELAARAPGGNIPKAARDSEGKLEAKVKNQSAKANQDKLTLAKPGVKDTATEAIAQEREAQEAASRAAELSRNISELGKIAAATVTGTAASEPASGALPVQVPASAAESNSDWIAELREHSLTPVGAGSLIAILVLVGLWRRRELKKAESQEDIHGLPPLNVKFNLDLPEFDNHDPVERGYIHEVATHAHDAHDLSHEHLHDDVHEASDHEAAHSARTEPAERPTMQMPNISLDLDDVDHVSPYQVRIDLADELWKLGQLHTSKALMEEVANEASGLDKEKALQWLAERG
jgi:FimV-like protein